MEQSKLILPSDRRHFIKQSAATLAAAACLPKVSGGSLTHAADSKSTSESLVKVLYESLNPQQKEKVCYDWNHMDEKRGLLRTRVAANWMINDQEVNGEFYTDDQRDLIRNIFEGIISPEWQSNFDKQLEDDCEENV